jgi:hypothetical protein
MMPPAATAILIGTGGAWHPQLVSRTLDRLARRIDRPVPMTVMVEPE